MQYLRENDRRGRGGPKRFDIDFDFSLHQEKLVSELSNIEKDIDINFEKYPNVPTVLKAKLRNKAWAKSHRPTYIFEKRTCPIIGLNNMGELLISATKSGIEKLKSKISDPTSQVQEANITTIEDISKIEEKDKLMGLSFDDLIIRSERKDNERYLKVILFDHQDDDINGIVKSNFLTWIEEQGLTADNISSFDEFPIWRVKGASESHLKEMISNPAIKTVSYFPSFEQVHSKNLKSDKIDFEYPAPKSGEEYPKIAVVDSGIPEKHPLNSWVIDRVSYVPKNYQNNFHGSFVGGLACMGDKLNGVGICPDEDTIQILDVVIVPDETKDSLYEDIFIERLNDCIPKIMEQYDISVWNMSLGFKNPVEDEKFSSLAILLDKIQDKYGIIISLPSGNYENIDNQRTWPPQHLNGADKLQAPADSVRAISVGAIACSEKPDSIVKLNHPTSYSCRGYGPTYIVKPEIVHYSGNLSISDGKISCNGQGICSFDENGQIVEHLGTSFSCPLGARTLAILKHKLASKVSNNMIKALLIHNSHTPTNIELPKIVNPYTGFGKPDSVENILNCSDSEITMLFDDRIYKGHNLSYPFVWPKSLTTEDGKCKGNLRMTLVSKVPLDEKYGSEYIRANVEVALQTKHTDDDGTEHWTGLISDELYYEGQLTELYEEERIKQGYKWKPIKRVEKQFMGKSIDELRINVNLLLRDGIDTGIIPVTFALVVTISDPEGSAPVYNDVMLGLRDKNVITDPVEIGHKLQYNI